MQQLKIRCLGGFDVRLGETPIESFESQKVRALLAYLVCQRHRAFDREHLAGLLWPERPEAVARRNLRQALYNLKQVLVPADSGETTGKDDATQEVVLADQRQVGLHPDLDCWLDVDAFEKARSKGLSRDRVDPHYLAEAAGLYRGEFLSGFSVRDSAEFEQWYLTEQSRLREAVIEVLHGLIENYLSRGELRLGTRFAHRLVAIDPLSESAYRYLIQLYGFSGRRQRALSQYEQLRELLQRELGVEPEEKTKQVLNATLNQSEIGDPVADEPVGPLLPMVGRAESYRQLEKEWSLAASQGSRLSIVEGEPGVGKTRLVRSFLDAASSKGRLLVLKSKCDDTVPTAYQPVVELLRNAIDTDTAIDTSGNKSKLQELSPNALAVLGRLLPEIVSSPAGRSTPAGTGQDLSGGILDVLDFLGRQCSLVALFLDDLHRADEESLRFFSNLLAHRSEVPVWMIATCQSGWERLRPTGSKILIERLDSTAVEEIASELVETDQTSELAGFLHSKSRGLPVLIAEWINFLWDEGALTRSRSRWRLTGSLAELPSVDPATVETLISHRLLRLPSSTRRIAVLASIVGHSFDAELLRQAENEHPFVIDLGLQILLEKWLLQKQAPRWSTAGGEQDVEPMPHGTRHGRFEFSHRRIRRAVYQTIAPERRKFLHLLVAAKLEASQDEPGGCCEQLAYHYTNAGRWREALGHLRAAAHSARRLGATVTAGRYLDRALETIDHILEETNHPETWQVLRSEISVQRAALGDVSPA